MDWKKHGRVIAVIHIYKRESQENLCLLQTSKYWCIDPRFFLFFIKYPTKVEISRHVFRYVYTFIKWLKILNYMLLKVPGWISEMTTSLKQRKCSAEKWKFNLIVRETMYSDNFKVPINNRQSVPTVSRPKLMEWIRMLK